MDIQDYSNSTTPLSQQLELKMATALFLGRFQPPHVGHLLTIKSLAGKFETLIVGVTECEPSVMRTNIVIGILEKLLPDDNISFIPVSGSVEGGTAVIDCNFDVCCSGNSAVISIMEKQGYETEYVERSLDAIFSGTNERKTYVDNAIETAASKTGISVANFEYVKTSSLRPVEKINPRHYAAIEKDIIESGSMLQPLIVDKVTLSVLDGSHRYAFLVKHGYTLSPVLLCDYDDESIFVGTHLSHRFEADSKKWISKKHVRATAISVDLYEPRTTRHFFPFRKEEIPTKLDILMKSEEQSIDHLVATVSKEDELEMNSKYVSELQHESKILTEYMNEQARVLAWLNQQNEKIGNS